MAVQKRVKGTEQKAKYLDIGAKLAAKYGAANITRRMMAKACKISEPLVAHYFGNTADAQKVYARQCKKLGLEQPSKEKIAEIGKKQRAAARAKPAPLTDDRRVVVYKKTAARAPKVQPLLLPPPPAPSVGQ